MLLQKVTSPQPLLLSPAVPELDALKHAWGRFLLQLMKHNADAAQLQCMGIANLLGEHDFVCQDN